MLSKIVLVLLVIAIAQTFGQPVLSSDKLVQCFQKSCPSATIGCKRVVQTSEDKKTLITKISCLDEQYHSSESFTDSGPNPYGPSTSLYSSSQQSTHVSNRGGPIDLNIGNKVEPTIEDFS